MKKLLVGSFALVLTLMLSTIAFAASYNITEYCGENGLINRNSDGSPTHYNKGDVLNVSTPTIVQNGVDHATHFESPEDPNLILSDGITINGNGATFDGGYYNGFIMVSSQGATVESTINDATLTNYGNNQEERPIIGIFSSSSTANSYAKLTLNDVNISTDNHYRGGSSIYVGVSTETANAELNIVSANKDVSMSSTSIVSYGKLNFKGKNINVNNVTVYGNKAVNDSNLIINEELNVYGASLDDRRSAPMLGVEPAEVITGEFTNNANKTLTVNKGVEVIEAKFNNKGTMTINGYLDIYSTSTFNNDGTLTINEKEDDDSGVDIYYNSTFNNNGTLTSNVQFDFDGGVFNNNGNMTVNEKLRIYCYDDDNVVFNNNKNLTISSGTFRVEYNCQFNNNGIVKSTGAYVDGEFNNNNKWTADGMIALYEESSTTYKNGVLTNKGIINANQGFEGDGTIDNYKDLNLGGDSSKFSGSLYVENGTVNLLKDATYFGSSSSNTYNNGTLNAANGSMDNIDLSKLRIAKTMKLNFDVDLAEVAIDSFTFSNIETYDPDQAQMASATNANQQEEVNAKISLSKINVMTDSKEKVTVYEFGTNAEEYINVGQKQVLGPVFTYKVSYGEEDKSTSKDSADDSGDNADNSNGNGNDAGTYNPAQDPTVGNDPTTGADAGSDEATKTNLLQFERLGGGDGEVDLNSGEKIKGPLNPVLLQSKVVIAASSISQEEVFDTVLNNAGNYTFFQKQGSNAGDVEDRAAPTLWIKAFGSQEDVDMEDYTKVKTTYYGAVVGLDWDRQYTDNFDATYGIFASYIGGEFKDEDWSEGDFKVKQNGGYVGLRGNWYVGKLFINGIVDYGMLQNDADNPYKSDDFNSSVIGLAARVGYNFEVARRRFTIQPSVGATGKYILTDDFETALKNGTEIKEKIDDVTNITIEPGLKLALNLGKCWILSGEGKYVVENFSGDTKVTGEDLDFILPDVSYKNYANVGLGIEKIWGYTVLHLKGNKTFGGRDGIIVNAGIEFKF